MAESNVRPVLYRVRDAMALLGVGETKIYEWIKDGTLDVVKVGTRNLRVTAESIERFLAANKVEPEG